MSGGSYNYKFQKIHDLAWEIAVSSNKSPMRKAFCKLLVKVAEAAKEIEWADSSDTEFDGPHERAKIEACFMPLDKAVTEACLESLKAEMEKIQACIKLLEEKK